MSYNWTLRDGAFYKAEEPLFTTADLSNILFREEIRSIRNQFPFWKEHLQLFDLKFRILNHPTPDILQNNGTDLRRQLDRFLVKNKLYKSAIIHIVFFKEKDSVSYAITHERLEQTDFTLNKQGLMLGIFDKLQKPVSSLSAISLGSETIWSIARHHIPTEVDSEILITNTQGYITESLGKNILLLKGNQVITPSASTGAYIDISRDAVFEAIRKAGYEITETNQVTEDELNRSEEVFLASAIQGIEWVKGFNNKRYFCSKIKKISEAFNELLI